jgi:hypothetical protein
MQQHRPRHGVAPDTATMLHDLGKSAYLKGRRGRLTPDAKP